RGRHFMERRCRAPPVTKGVLEVHIKVATLAEVVNAGPRLIGPPAKVRQAESVYHTTLGEDYNVCLDGVETHQLGLGFADAVKEALDKHAFFLLALVRFRP